ncbi:MAG: stringent starvation protein B [Deltaproteobacteria bacterium]|nr:stringent starvation protein B [Deltaproteobacteria bacterium]
MVPQAQIKRERLKKMLVKGMVMVHLDARHPGVSVPPQYAADPHLRLNLSYRFAPYDLDLGEELVQATLTFGGAPWRCQVPYGAIFLLTSRSLDESLLWLEDVPAEELPGIVDSGRSPLRPVAMLSRQEPEPELSRAVGGESRRGHLRLVK